MGTADDRYYLAKSLSTVDSEWVWNYATTELAKADIAEKKSREVWAEISVLRARTLAHALKDIASALAEDIDKVRRRVIVESISLGKQADSNRLEREFEEHEHAHATVSSDNNMRAAFVHVFADAAISVLVIIGLSLAWAFGWLWMDPLAGIVGSLVIANWAYGLIRDTGTILLDMNPDKTMTENLRQSIETDGDKLADLHLWRLGPGHLGAVVSVVTNDVKRDQQFYRKRLSRFRSLSHLTIEVLRTV